MALLKFVEQEGQRPLETPAPDQVQFPFKLLQVSFYLISYSLTLSITPSLPLLFDSCEQRCSAFFLLALFFLKYDKLILCSTSSQCCELV